MLQKITMPAAGQTTDQMLILKWNKQEGDEVKRGDVLIEIETDKATLEVESFAQGILLKKLFDEGETAISGEVIAYVGQVGDMDSLETPAETKAPESPVAKAQDEEDEYQPIMKGAPQTVRSPETAAKETGAEIKASPAAKKLARELKADLVAVSRELKKNLIKEEDIRTYAGLRGRAGETDEEFELVPTTKMRRTIAERMCQSAFSIPVYTVEVEVDMESCMALRAQLNAAAGDVKISYNDILAKCAATAAAKHPYVNASYEEDSIRVYKKMNAGFAVSVENGLVVPVVRDIAAKGLKEIAAGNAANIAKAREGKIAPSDLEGGTFTISNLGMFPVSKFTAIINQPQSCILAVGSIVKKPVWTDRGAEGRSMMTITATFDHRLVDGAYGAAFLKDLKELLENPAMLLL